MFYLALGAAALAFVLWAGKGGRILKHREWRLGAGVLALAAFAAAAAVGVRGGWPLALALVVLGLWLAVSARSPGQAPRRETPMSLADARALLGVEANASPAEIKAAYTRLMRLAHPDRGGTTGLARQLNAARDRLLGK